jgi:3-oxoacyl-[acyl-carrier-protein] synthase II
MVTAVGLDRDSSWEAMVAGRGGVAPLQGFADLTDYKTNFAAQVKGFDPETIMDPKDARKADRFVHLAMAAAVQAVEQAGLAEASASWSIADSFRAGVIIGSGIGGMGTFEEQHSKLVARGPRAVSPLFIPMMISDMAAGLVSIRFGFRGANYCTVSACASGGHAIGAAFDQIRLGKADIMICGGSEAAVCPMSISGFANMKALSSRNDEPHRASRPFDRDRDGFVLGEGAGILILESEEHALARGAKIYGEVCGYGMTADAYHMTQPDNEGTGAIGSMTQAIQDAGLRLEQIGYINAHGTSTHFNDMVETRAIKSVFGDHAKKLKISSTKSMIGHLLGAAGGVEAVVTILAMHEGILPPTVNLENPDPECDLDYCALTAVKQDVEFALSNSFGFGGHNLTLCLGARR